MPRFVLRQVGHRSPAEGQLVRGAVRFLDLLPPDRPDPHRAIDLGKDGEEIFNQGINLIWKQQVVNGSTTKRTIRWSTCRTAVRCRTARPKTCRRSPLYGQEVVWTEGKPQ